MAACFAAISGLSFACEPYVEEHATATTASLRQHVSDFERCQMSEITYQQVVSAWLRNRPAGSPELSSLYLGRAVSFPWISRYLADAALQVPGWAARVSRANPGERHRLAGQLLNDPSLLERLAVPFGETRYMVVGMSFEKVLFGNASDYSSDQGAGKVKVPFDAQLWLRLKPRQGNAIVEKPGS